MIRISAEESEQQETTNRFDKSKNNPQRILNNRGKLLAICAIIFMIGIIIGKYYGQDYDVPYQNQIKHQHSTDEKTNIQHQLRTINQDKKDQTNLITSFKKILWVQTDKELDAKDMLEAIVARNHMYFGSGGGFEVRVIDDLSAYDYLSEQTAKWIKETHQRSSVHIPVYELLRIALLYEHGGVSLRLPNIILTETLDWAEAIIQGKTLIQGKTGDRSAFSCGLMSAPDAVLLHRDAAEGQQFMDDFIVARPKAKIFKKLMEEIADITEEGIWPYPKYNVTAVNPKTEAVAFPNIVEALLNVYNGNLRLCEEFNLESFHQNDGIIITAVDDKDASKTIKQNQQTFQQTHGKVKMLRINMQNTVGDIITAIKNREQLMEGDSLLKNKLFMVEGNKWLTLAPKKYRKVHFCIVSLSAQNLKEGQQSAINQQQRLLRQSFGSWNLVSFVEGLQKVSQNITDKIVLVNASNYEGLNLQRAATKYCHPQSVILLLDKHQSLSSDMDLERLARHFEPIGTYAAYLGIKTKTQLYQPSQESLGIIQRVPDSANFKILSDLANFLRAFTVQSYRFIPYFDLCHSPTGRYYDRQIALLALVQTEGDQSKCLNTRLIYHLKRFQTFMDVPRKKAKTEIIVNSQSIKVVNSSNYEYYYKYRHYTICQSMEYFHYQQAKIDYLAVFNNGRQQKGLDSRTGMPQLIPRKIHQTWIKSGEMPAYKKYLTKRVRDQHPDYEYLLWTEQNITRQNFPQSYDLMQSLIKFDKKSPYNKMSMISDLIRHQVVYRYGGFYLDTNYMLFGHRPLDRLLTYSVVSGADYIPFMRCSRASAFFGASKNSPHMARLMNHRMLSTRNYFSEQASIQAGPGLFGKSIVGDEEYRDYIFQVTMEQLYPYFGYQKNNKCQAPQDTPDSELLFKSQTRKYWKNCEQIYNYALGMDFLSEGSTWAKRRW